MKKCIILKMNSIKVPFTFQNKQQLLLNKNTGYTECSKNGVLTVHYVVEEATVNVRKMFKKFYWTYLLIWRSLKVGLTRKIILKYMN
jgi:hypothetical protein